ncbi:3D domain-containing protein [Mangrovimonas sp. TPBH4]|uniref:3D domain-containing protein n=1 Tax=Mangrovimonas sp. TPBH4 TaxID=1645914 RepID=UPI0006B58FD8|nr:3D domain-containing protein [Mangrovimonas sp. TPBH4]
MESNATIIKVLGVLFLVLAIACKKEVEPPKTHEWKTLKVTATAYNSLESQTNSNPHITAFGDSIKPGLKYIAVSRDLLKKGIKHNTPVMIEGFDDLFLVKDKMHTRWTNRIDIYMGVDVDSARNWGRKKVKIKYQVEIDQDSIPSELQIK